jgi:antitoxin component YwqK of YwqJK toxin-antitoxin module
MNITTRFITLLFTVFGVTGYNLCHSQSILGFHCINKYQDLIKSMKSNEGQFDRNVNKFFNLHYYNKDVTSNELKNFFSFVGTKNSKEYVLSSFQIDSNSGIIFLIKENKYSWANTYYYRLRAFHPIIGPLQFYEDEVNGHLILPKQTKKVSITSRGYSPSLGFELKVIDDKENRTVVTQINDSYGDLWFLFERESQLAGINDYPIESEYNTFYGTKRVLDANKTKVVEFKYFPSYQEKLTIYNIGGLPIEDLKNPNFYIIKTKKEEFFKNEVYGRKGTRHFLNDCFDELEASFSNYFIYRSNGKYGILDASWEKLKNSKFIILNNVYDNVVWNKGTHTFNAHQGNEILIINLDSLVEISSSIENNTKESPIKSSNTNPDGIKVTYRDNGTLESKIEYKDGKKNGLYERYDYWGDPNDIKLSFRCEMKNDLMNGYCEFYVNEKWKYLNGKLDKKRSGYYVNGKKMSDL